MKIKKDDIVKVIAGKDKGKTGKVLRTIPKKDLVVVEKVNVVTKHIKPRGPQNPYGIEKMEAPIHVSNVMYFDSASGKATRIGYKYEDGKKLDMQNLAERTLNRGKIMTSRLQEKYKTEVVPPNGTFQL